MGSGGERVHANRHAGLPSVEVTYNTSAATTTTKSQDVSLQEQGFGSSAAEGNPVAMWGDGFVSLPDNSYHFTTYG